MKKYIYNIFFIFEEFSEYSDNLNFKNKYKRKEGGY